jgi:cysteine desulfurase
MTAAIARKANQPPVYLDYQATTPVDPRVLAAMLPWFTEKFGNPSSITHAYGREAEAAVERARGQLAALIKADPREIVFTSGATEANNTAVKGALRFHKQFGPNNQVKDHIVTLVTEHKCVLESAKAMEAEGCRATYLPVESNGIVDLDRLKNAIDDNTAIVSVMAAHNEIGVIQPLAEIGAICRERGVLLHTDAAQAVGKIPMDVDAMNIDLMSISGHKIYGPKGIGALYMRRRPRARLAPLIDGGGQERGMRSGTLPTPLCIGLGEAAALAEAEMAGEARRLFALRQRFLAGIKHALPQTILNGDAEQRLPGNLNLSFPGIPAPALMEACPALALSTGSACTAAEIEPSFVLRALGLSDELAAASLRIGLGRFTTEDEVDFAVATVAAAVKHLGQAGVTTRLAATT